MTSRFEQHGQLSRSTLELWERLQIIPTSTADLVDFWICYFKDVVPSRVSVFHIETRDQSWDLNGNGKGGTRNGRARTPTLREEITLRCDEGILMDGLASVERNPIHIEELAGNLAWTHWRAGRTAPDHLQAWGMFTCLKSLRCYSSRDGMEWIQVAAFHPIKDVQQVVAYIRQEYERIRRS